MRGMVCKGPRSLWMAKVESEVEDNSTKLKHECYEENCGGMSFRSILPVLESENSVALQDGRGRWQRGPAVARATMRAKPDQKPKNIEWCSKSVWPEHSICPSYIDACSELLQRFPGKKAYQTERQIQKTDECDRQGCGWRRSQKVNNTTDAEGYQGRVTEKEVRGLTGSLVSYQ